MRLIHRSTPSCPTRLSSHSSPMILSYHSRLTLPTSLMRPSCLSYQWLLKSPKIRSLRWLQMRR